MKKILMSVLVLALLVACNNDDNNEYFQSNFTNIATVENPNQSSGFYFKLDNNDKMWITSTNFPYYRPKDGQRIIAVYNILSTVDNSNLYNHKVQLNDVYEVLTKGIFKITPETQDSIGNDQIEIRDMWVGSNYLNVEFVYPGYNQIHFINLVSDSTKTYTDGKVHLEFRHNANNDYATYSKWGVVSFDLSSLQPLAVGDSVNLVIHTHEFTTTENETYNLTYKLGNAGSSNIREMKIPKGEIKLQ